VDGQPVPGVFAADLLVHLCGRRRRPGSEFDQEGVCLRVVQYGLAGHGLNLRSRKVSLNGSDGSLYHVRSIVIG
jgi:hypothetical protein